MKKLAAMLAVTLVMAIAIPLTGCGDNSNSAVITYVARPNTGSGPYPPSLYILDPTTLKSTAVSISIPTTAAYVSANSDATQVVYSRSVAIDNYIFLMGLDSKEKQLTTTAGDDDVDAVFSPDGNTIAFVNKTSASNNMLVTMNTDGTNQKTIYTSPANNIFLHTPEFSPDGKSLVFYISVDSTPGVIQTHRHNAPASSWMHERNRRAQNAVRSSAHPQNAVPTASGYYTMALTGMAPTLVYSTTYWWGPAVYSADGTKLLFSMYDGTEGNIFSVDLDGSNVKELTTSTDEVDFSPVPYKNSILYNRYNSVTSSADIYTMDQTGANQTFVHSTPDVWEGLIDAYWEYD